MQRAGGGWAGRLHTHAAANVEALYPEALDHPGSPPLTFFAPRPVAMSSADREKFCMVELKKRCREAQVEGG